MTMEIKPKKKSNNEHALSCNCYNCYMQKQFSCAHHVNFDGDCYECVCENYKKKNIPQKNQDEDIDSYLHNFKTDHNSFICQDQSDDFLIYQDLEKEQDQVQRNQYKVQRKRNEEQRIRDIEQRKRNEEQRNRDHEQRERDQEQRERDIEQRERDHEQRERAKDQQKQGREKVQEKDQEKQVVKEQDKEVEYQQNLQLALISSIADAKSKEVVALRAQLQSALSSKFKENEKEKDANSEIQHLLQTIIADSKLNKDKDKQKDKEKEKDQEKSVILINNPQKLKGAEKTDIEDSQCVICYDYKKTVCANPCMHVCLCLICAEKLGSSILTCPICRTPIKQWDALSL